LLLCVIFCLNFQNNNRNAYTTSKLSISSFSRKCFFFPKIIIYKISKSIWVVSYLNLFSEYFKIIELVTTNFPNKSYWFLINNILKICTNYLSKNSSYCSNIHKHWTFHCIYIYLFVYKYIVFIKNNSLEV